MNEHTRKLLADARNRKFTNVFNDVEFNDLDMNAIDDKGWTLLHYVYRHKRDSILINVLENFDPTISD